MREVVYACSAYLLFMSAIFVACALAIKPYYPSPTLTPGLSVPGLTAADVCAPGYARAARKSADAGIRRLKPVVAQAYGVRPSDWKRYEFDHFVPITLGGHPDSEKNLWPQPHRNVAGVGAWGSEAKDRLEDRLHLEVCSGKISLKAAQEEIASDWTEAYRKRFGEAK